MTKADIISIAREAGMGGMLTDVVCTHAELVRFATLLEEKVRAEEREACAKMVEDWDLECFNYLACPRVVADAIRARGEK